MRSNNTNKAVRCAIIGIGTMGKKYAFMIDHGDIEGLCLAAVVCRSDANADWAKANLADTVKICRSEDALYEEPDLFDAVIIVTPHKQHPAMTIRALEAGKHVMCDKPAGTTAADAESMNAAAARSGKVYAMMCHQRTYAQHVKVKELLDEGAIGEIRRALLESSGSFRTHFYHRSSDWRSSWTGEGVPTERLEIVGSGGRILLDGTTVTLTRFYTDLREYIRDAQVTSTQELSETEEIFEFGKPDRAYYIMLQNFADAILTGEALIAPGEDGSKTLSLVNAAYMSAWKGQKIALPLDMDAYEAQVQEKMTAEKR